MPAFLAGVRDRQRPQASPEGVHSDAAISRFVLNEAPPAGAMDPSGTISARNLQGRRVSCSASARTTAEWAAFAP